jgi:hypothetical protein
MDEVDERVVSTEVARCIRRIGNEMFDNIFGGRVGLSVDDQRWECAFLVNLEEVGFEILCLNCGGLGCVCRALESALTENKLFLFDCVGPVA